MIIHDKSNVKEFLKMLEELKSISIEIGILGDDKGGDKHKGSDITVLEIATIHEFGAPKANIPSRSFIRAGYDSNKNKIISQGEKLLENVIGLKLDPDIFLETMGENAVGMIQEHLTNLKSPPLKQTTIKRKGSSQPLIDTGQLRSSITHKIKKG